MPDAIVLSDLETFTALFKQLQASARDRPENLSWISDNKPEIRRLCYLVEELAARTMRARAASSQKHIVFPPGYVTSWEEYERSYRAVVRAIYEAEVAIGSQQFLNDLERIAQSKNMEPDALLHDLLAEIHAGREEGDSFDPTADNPAELVGEIFCAYSDAASSGIFGDEDHADKAVGAWRFFEKTLGVDHSAIHERWKKAPELLIPRHALQVNAKPLFELYNEAVRCYVFGNLIAAISMCRALLEHILTKHYGLQERDLQNVIVLAEEKFRKFRGLDLQAKRRLANDIMHAYERNPTIDDSVVIDFLRTIRSIVRDIPRVR